MPWVDFFCIMHWFDRGLKAKIMAVTEKEQSTISGWDFETSIQLDHKTVGDQVCKDCVAASGTEEA